MYEILLGLWIKNRITETDLDTAIKKGWINLNEKEIIMKKEKEI